jgi:hypothetical protein
VLPVTSETASFKLVERDFVFEKGQKVGIAVFFHRKPSLETARHSKGHPLVGVSEQQLETIFGPPNGVNIYTGEITFVGETHIEYDINSFKGCGAVVFLLDKNQPTSVRPLDYGTAVAVPIPLGLIATWLSNYRKHYCHEVSYCVVGTVHEPPSLALRPRI